MAFILKSFTSTLNGSTAAMVTLINAWLASNPSFFLRDLTMSRRSSARSSEQLTVRLTGESSASGPGYAATLLQGSTTAFEVTCQAYWAANPTRALVAQIDLTSPSERDGSGIAMLVITTAGQDRAQVYAAAPAANILTGASGTATLYDADGVSAGTATVVNRGPGTWTGGQRSPVVWAGAGWVGMAPA
jgi:hypothetical protein